MLRKILAGWFGLLSGLALVVSIIIARVLIESVRPSLGGEELAGFAIVLPIVFGGGFLVWETWNGRLHLKTMAVIHLLGCVGLLWLSIIIAYMFESRIAMLYAASGVLLLLMGIWLLTGDAKRRLGENYG